MQAVVTTSEVGSRRVDFAFCYATQQPDGTLTLRYVATRAEGDVLRPVWETPDDPGLLPTRYPPGFRGLGYGRIFYHIDDFDPWVVYRRGERGPTVDPGGVDPVGAGDAGVPGDADVGGHHPNQADGDGGHVVVPPPAAGSPPRQ